MTRAGQWQQFFVVTGLLVIAAGLLAAARDVLPVIPVARLRRLGAAARPGVDVTSSTHEGSSRT